MAVLLLCGNGWLVGAFVRPLECRYASPDPIPKADCILVLSGGVLGQAKPRPTIEIAEAGNRVLYAAWLYRQGKAPRILCTGGIATGGESLRAEAEDMAELLENLGVPKAAILMETKARNTHEHATNLNPLFKEHGFKRVVLVTSAMHMPRSMGVFQRLCPSIRFIPAATDFRAPQRVPTAWYRQLATVVPTLRNLLNWSDATHEYFGIVYYRLRGWM